MASSAVKDVHKRIQTMNDAISEHLKAIKELTEQKHAAWGELNYLRDPMSRLPLELSSMIFRRCVGPEYDDLQPHAYTAPMLLMRICRSWTQIALATPSLWTDIHIHITIPYIGFGNLFEIGWTGRNSFQSRSHFQGVGTRTWRT
ncbi:hypothetical protein FB45DRAFT_801845 [Roridomyces roridus]|uniref:F-box domain-containing protein n=1 Tax=Roridomyces roridus TaxID=1738132 RepID=A0AAD7BAR4_9AGAR|nr:hypothetical protein FB45DRAFT_801845 [Roridomyces roridus]